MESETSCESTSINHKHQPYLLVSLTCVLDALILRKPCHGNTIPHVDDIPGGQPRSKSLL